MDLNIWITNASIISPLIPLVCLFIYWKKQPRQNHILALSLFISFTCDVISWTLRLYKVNSNLFINLYFIAAFPAIMWFYNETLKKPTLKIMTRIFTIGFFVLALIFAIDRGLYNTNFNTWMLSSILMSVTSLFFVADLNLMDQSTFTKNPFHESNILVNTSLALYYFVTVVVFALSEYVVTHTTLDGFLQFWNFHNTIHVLKNVGLTVAFYLCAKRFDSLMESQQPKTTASADK